jgi:phage protein D/phage baseplate assembly protein gpV
MASLGQSKVQNQDLNPTFQIKLNGSDITRELIPVIKHIEVHQNLYIPGMFIIQVSDPEYKLADTKFKIGSEIEIFMGQSPEKLGKSLILGEVTAADSNDDSRSTGGTILNVRGYSWAHRLHRGRLTRTFNNVKVSDVIQQIAGEVSMKAEITATGGLLPYLCQRSQTNWEFANYLAKLVGMELTSEGKTLRLRPRTPGPSAGELQSGTSLIKASKQLTSHDQVDKVIVRSWDWKQKKEIVGEASSSKNTPTSGIPDAKTSTSKFGSGKVITITDQPVTNPTQAEELAQSVLDDVTGRYYKLKGTAYGDSVISSGSSVQIKGLGQADGTYYLADCVHEYTSGHGYIVNFAASGRQTNSFSESAGAGAGGGGGSSSSGAKERGKISGVVIGIVTNNADPENKGRVKVKFPTIDEKLESDWARIAAPGAGKERGFYWLPEVGDEVLVAFENGDPHRAFLVGYLWNGSDAPVRPNSAVINGGATKKRLIRSRLGHLIEFDDSDGEPFIEIIEKDLNLRIHFDSKKKVLTVEAKKGDIEIKALQNNILVEAKQKIDIKAMTIDIKAQTAVNIEAPQIKVKGSGMVEVSAPMVKIN